MKRHLFSYYLAFLLVAFVSCSEDSSSDSLKETGTLMVQLTDAPFPYDLVAEANVTVFKVEARQTNEEDSDESEDENEESDSSFVTLMESEIAVNLLDLTNGSTQMLAELEVPAGTYDLVRVYVKGINVLLTDGRSFDLKVPSGEQTGIKVFVKPGIEVVGGLSADLLLDFDVSRSFVAKGNTKTVDGINGFNFKPVIKASNMSTSGTLSGLVTTIQQDSIIALEGAQISIFSADTLNTTAFSDMEGKYSIMGLTAGSYRSVAEKEGFISSDTLDITITAGNKTVQDFSLNEEEATDGGSGD